MVVIRLLGAEPRPHILALARPPAVEAEQAAEQALGRHVGPVDLRAGIEGGEPPGECLRLGAGQVGLGHHEMVGHRRLPQGFAVRVEGGGAVDRVDHRHHPLQLEADGEIGVVDQRVQDRRRVGQPRGLDHDPSERVDSAVVAAAQQIFERRDQVAAHGAAQASRTEQDHPLVHRLDQQVVETDLAELVDDHHRVGQRRVGEEAVQQRGFARAEKAGEHGERDRLGAAGLFGLGHGATAFEVECAASASPPEGVRLHASVRRP